VISECKALIGSKASSEDLVNMRRPTEAQLQELCNTLQKEMVAIREQADASAKGIAKMISSMGDVVMRSVRGAAERPAHSTARQCTRGRPGILSCCAMQTLLEPRGSVGRGSQGRVAPDHSRRATLATRGA
jgi:hypothetical protein